MIGLLFIHCYFELALKCNAPATMAIIRAYCPEPFLPLFYTIEWFGIDRRLKDALEPLGCVGKALVNWCKTKFSSDSLTIDLKCGFAKEGSKLFWTIRFLPSDHFVSISIDRTRFFEALAKVKLNFIHFVLQDFVNMAYAYLKLCSLYNCDLLYDRLQVTYERNTSCTILCRNGVWIVERLGHQWQFEKFDEILEHLRNNTLI